MFAERIKGNILFYDHVAVLYMKPFGKMRRCAVMIAGSQLLVHLGNPVGRFEKPFSIYIFADSFQNQSHTFFNLVFVH